MKFDWKLTVPALHASIDPINSSNDMSVGKHSKWEKFFLVTFKEAGRTNCVDDEAPPRAKREE